MLASSGCHWADRACDMASLSDIVCCSKLNGTEMLSPVRDIHRHAITVFCKNSDLCLFSELRKKEAYLLSAPALTYVGRKTAMKLLVNILGIIGF